MEYFSAIKENEITSFAVTPCCMDLEIIIQLLLFKMKYIRERQISYDVTYMWNLKSDINGEFPCGAAS